MNTAPIWIVDDDTDDREFLHDAFRELDYTNRLVFFNTGEEALEHLRSEKTPPFLILCDVNLPNMDGFELKRKIYEDTELNYRSIPFVFWSSAPSHAQIQRAYDLGGNGFFIKGSTFSEIKQSLIDIVRYWRNSQTPY